MIFLQLSWKLTSDGIWLDFLRCKSIQISYGFQNKSTDACDICGFIIWLLQFNCHSTLSCKIAMAVVVSERLHFKHGTLHLGHTMSPSLTHSVRWHALSTFSSISDWPFVFFAKKKVIVFLDWLSFCTTSEDRESGNSHGDS